MANLEYYQAAVLRLWGAAALTKTATQATLATSNADWMPTSDVVSRVKDAIDEVLGALADALGNSDRSQIVSTKTAIPHGQLLDGTYLPRLGQIAGIRVSFDAGATYQPAERDNARAIEAYREERGEGELQLEHYAYELLDGRLYHTGDLASCEYVPKTTNYDTAAGLIPGRYNGTVIALAAEKLAILISPSRVQGAAAMSAIANRGLAAIAQNQSGPTEADVREAASFEGT